MKVIIAGSRDIYDMNIVCDAMRLVFGDGPYDMVEEVVSGAARGADRLGELWAQQHGIPVKRFPADWNNHGRAAGVIRNGDMALYADALVAVWDGQSRGTRNMIETMRRLGKACHVYRLGTPGIIEVVGSGLPV